MQLAQQIRRRAALSPESIAISAMTRNRKRGSARSLSLTRGSALDNRPVSQPACMAWHLMCEHLPATAAESCANLQADVAVQHAPPQPA